MSLGASLFLIALGAILNFAVTAELAGIELQTVGVIFMIIGGLGLVLGNRRVLHDGAPSAPARP